jgi:hypothetical protein
VLLPIGFQTDFLAKDELFVKPFCFFGERLAMLRSINSEIADCRPIAQPDCVAVENSGHCSSRNGDREKGIETKGEKEAGEKEKHGKEEAC